jgi:membrane protease YdiL (CAAX protease family)
MAILTFNFIYCKINTLSFVFIYKNKYMKKILLMNIIIILELFYLGTSYQLAEIYGQWSFQGEIIRTGLRLIALLLLGWIYWKYFYGKVIAVPTQNINNRTFIISVALLLLFAVVYTNAENETVIWQLTFAISGIIAGFREEIIYRGMLQNYLQQKLHYRTALFLTTLVFTLSHIQYVIYQQNFALVMTAISSIIFGCIYYYSGRVLLTGLIHGSYDAMLSINISPIKLNHNAELPFLLLIMLFFLALANKK